MKFIRKSKACNANWSYHDCIQAVITRMDGIADAGVRQSEMIVPAECGIREICSVVQTSSADAAKSAAVSGELSGRGYLTACWAGSVCINDKTKVWRTPNLFRGSFYVNFACDIPGGGI